MTDKDSLLYISCPEFVGKKRTHIVYEPTLASLDDNGFTVSYSEDHCHYETYIDKPWREHPMPPIELQ